MYETEPLEDEFTRRNRVQPQGAGGYGSMSDSGVWSDDNGDPNTRDGDYQPPGDSGVVDTPTSDIDKPIKAKKDATSDHNVDMIGPKGPTHTTDVDQPSFQPPATDPVQQPTSSAISPTNPITDEVTKILMARLNELKNPGDVYNDPIYQQAVRMNQLGLLRSAERQRKALAERSAAGGTRSSGGFNVNTRGIYEEAGTEGARYASGLAMNRLSAREAQLNEAIRLARAVGQDAIANQLEIARLELQRELGRGDLSLRRDLGFGRLGYDYTDLIMRENRNSVLAGLGG